MALSGKADKNKDGKLILYEVIDWTTEHTKDDVKKYRKETQVPYLKCVVTDFILYENGIVEKANKLAAEAKEAMKDKCYDLAVRKYDEALKLCPKSEDWLEQRTIGFWIKGGTPYFSDVLSLLSRAPGLSSREKKPIPRWKSAL